MSRILGIDLARAIAIGGMFVAHLAKRPGDSWWWGLADGRPSALFALLAGCGLGFMTARTYPNVNAEYRRILLRAFYLGILGVGLLFLGTPVVVILSSYAVMFALTVPFLHLPPRTLFAWAGAIVVLTPPLVQGLRLAVNGAPQAGVWIPGLFEIATGYYPALSWLAYSLVGLALVRLPLREAHTQAQIGVTGIVIAVTGYGGGFFSAQALQERGASPYLLSLVSPSPHTDSGFEILGNIGTSMLVISLSLLLMRTAAARVLLAPVTAAGSMSLTLYVSHLLYIRILGDDAVWNPASQAPLLWLIGGSLAFAWGWAQTFGKGPFERILANLSSPPRHRHPGPSAPPPVIRS